jgi:hypothetical protein
LASSGTGGALRGLAGEAHDVQAGVGAIGQVDQAALIGLDVVVWIATLQVRAPFVTHRSAVRSVVAGM